MQGTFHPDMAAMRLNNSLTDIEAQTGTGQRIRTGVAPAPETLENLLLVAQRDTHSPVGHAHHHLLTCGTAGHLDYPLVWGILDSIVQQVLQDFFDAIPVGHHRWQIVWNIKVDAHIWRFRLQAAHPPRSGLPDRGGQSPS